MLNLDVLEYITRIIHTHLQPNCINANGFWIKRHLLLNKGGRSHGFNPMQAYGLDHLKNKKSNCINFIVEATNDRKWF